MTRVTLVTPVFAPYRAGMARVPEQDAELLAAQGCVVTVVTPDYGRRGQSPEIMRESGVSFAVRRVLPWFAYGNAAIVPPLLHITVDAEVVFLHYPFFGSAEWVALGRAFFRRGRLVVVFHMDAIANGFLGILFSLYRFFLQPFVLWCADRVVVSSFDYAAQSSLGRFLARHADRVVEIPLVVDTVRFSPGERSVALLGRYGIPKDALVVMFLGALDEAHRFKGIDGLLVAFAQLPPSAWLLVCGGGPLLEEYQRQARMLQVADRVVFTGFVAEEELPAHYRLAHVFAFPSLNGAEAFGVAALEAMASGVPVVASALPGVRSLVADGVCGTLVAPGDVRQFSIALATLLAETELRAAYSAAARNRAVQSYSLAARSGALRDLVRALVI